MATSQQPLGPDRVRWCFQSIGVTKEWRPGRKTLRYMNSLCPGFQSIGVTKEWRPPSGEIRATVGKSVFPINRRHQRMATRSMRWSQHCAMLFPINRRHQRMATRADRSCVVTFPVQFPINRRHQRMATTHTFDATFRRLPQVSNQ